MAISASREARDLNNPVRIDQMSWSSSAIRQSIARFVAARQLDAICGRHNHSRRANPRRIASSICSDVVCDKGSHWAGPNISNMARRRG